MRVAALFVILLSALSLGSIALQGQKAYAHHVVEEIATGKGPMQMSLAGDTLFVANVGQPSVSVIDTGVDRTIGTINTTAAVSTLYAVPQLDKLYVSVFDKPIVRVYNLTTFEFIKNIELPGAVLNYWLFPGNNYTPRILMPTGGSSMDFDPTTGMMYVAIYSHDHMEVIDTKTDTATKTIDLPAHPSAVKVDPVAQMVLVTSTAGNRLSFVSTQTNQVVGDMVTGTAPWDLAVDTTTHTAYITHLGSFYVASVDIPTREVTAKIPVTDEAQAIAVDSSEHKVYFSTFDGQSIIKVNGKTNDVETIIETDGVPTYLLADSSTHRLYVSTNQSDKVVVLGPNAISASFPVVTSDSPSAVVGTIKIHGQDVLPSAPTLSIANKTLSVFVESQDGGNLTMSLPREMLDSQGSQFQVMVAGKQTTYQEAQPVNEADGTQSRVITVFVPKGTSSLQVIGTQVVPEFGTLSEMILGIGLVSVTVYAGRKMKRASSTVD